MIKRLALACAVAVAFGCQRTPAQSTTTTAGQNPASTAAQPTPNQPAAASAPAKEVPAELPAVVARVNGQPISKGDLEKAVRNLERQVGQQVPPDRRSEIIRNVLSQLVTFHLLAQEATTRGVAVADADVETHVASLRKNFPNEDAFTKALAQQSLTVDELRAGTRRDLLVARMLEKEINPTVSVADADVQKFYDANTEKFEEPGAVRASHVLIRVDPKADPATKQQAKAKIEGVLKQARGGADFAALAKEHSQDPQSAVQGGDLGFFPKGQMVPTFEAAAFSTPPGQITDVIETQFGYHIIKVAEQKPGRTVPVAEVRDKIRDYLQQRQRQEKTMALVETLKTKAKVEILI